MTRFASSAHPLARANSHPNASSRVPTARLIRDSAGLVGCCHAAQSLSPATGSAASRGSTVPSTSRNNNPRSLPVATEPVCPDCRATASETHSRTSNHGRESSPDTNLPGQTRHKQNPSR